MTDTLSAAVIALRDECNDCASNRHNEDGYREANLHIAAKLDPLIPQIAALEQQFADMTKARDCAMDERNRYIAQLHAAAQQHAQMMCHLCNEEIKQVSSATMGLAIWQHYTWVHGCTRALAAVHLI